MKSYERTTRESWGESRFESQNVITQGLSPWVDGKLQLRPNLFRFIRESSSYSPIRLYDQGKHVLTVSSRLFIPGYEPENYKTLQRARDEAANKMLQKIAGIRVNALELYATRVETANTVAKRMMQLAQSALALKRGNWKQFKKHLGLSKTLKKPGAHKFEDIPGLWLEYSFGWVPLYSDIYTILNKTFEPPSLKVKAVHKSDRTIDIHRRSNTYDQVGIKTYKTRVTCTADVQVDVPALAAISQYGLNNPAAVAWELVPYSFVVDWFLPVGDYIEQMGATAGLKVSNFSSTLTADYILVYNNDVSQWARSLGLTADTKAPCFVFFREKDRRMGATPSYKFLVPENPLDQSLRRFSYALSLFSLALTRKK